MPGVSNKDLSVIRVRVRYWTTVSSVTFPVDGDSVVELSPSGVGANVPLLTDKLGAMVPLIARAVVGTKVTLP